MKSSYYLDTLRGRSQELPAVRSKVVRIFLSSTFTDTLTERDSLIENIFPKLKDYCREKYGLEFQYADMRWGIQTESANNHGEVTTCLKEIELCKKYSVATNFVVLLSHRYGSRPIPAEISAQLFDLLKSTVLEEQNENNDGDLLTQWYQLDTNSTPASYILRNISSILPNFISKNTDEVKEADKEWKKINNRLRLCLRQAAATCLERGQITENDYDEFFVSVTEKEIINGILSASDANERTLCFLREIVDIHEHLDDEKVSKFIDMSSHGNDQPNLVDEEAEKLLDRLKNVRIPAALKSQNIYKYRVRWSPNGIQRTKHAEYIQQFNEEFYKAMKDQIDRCVQSRFTKGTDSLQHEVIEHAIQRTSYVSKFHGRTDVLAELEKYVKNNAERHPCIVYGESGCGKTSVLAKTATEIFQWWPRRSVSVILRFLGTTPTSSTIYKTLLSISEQICEIYRLSMVPYSTVDQLRDQLEMNLLSQIPDNEYLLILLDSIDQLHTDAYSCQWLLDEFPSNVKCIVSTLPDHGNILKTLQTRFIKQPHLFVHVLPFAPATVEIVYDDWLKKKQRSLSDDQRRFVQNLMEKRHEILPLFMKLVFDIISVWRSFDTIDEDLNNLVNVDDCIRYLFHRFETIHHKVLFSRALCYMTACRSGISQNELEDVLSLDDDVLKSVFQHYIPPVRRLPGILWTRIRNDLDEYITEKEVDDAPVIYWYHRRFIEVARELYVSNLSKDDQRLVFQNVVDLFKETWKGKNKPFKIDDPKLVNKYRLDQSDGEIQANRFTTSQPVEFVDINGRIQYNKRKLNELPQFLSKLTPDIAVPIAAEEIFFNYSFMHAKFSCSPFVDFQADLETFSHLSSYKSSPDVINTQKEISFLPMTYMLFGLLLNEYPDNYAFELTSRLLPLYNYKPNLTRLMKQCDEQSPRHCALIVPYNQISPPGNGLMYSMNKHTMPVVDLDFANGQMAAISLSNKIFVIDMRTGNTALDIKLPKIDEVYMNSTTMPKMIVPEVDEELNYDSSDSDSSADSNVEKFKDYVFFVNSLHHVYLISSHSDVKFEKNSLAGFLTVEVLDHRRGLCLLYEQNSSIVECWDVGKNKVYANISLPSNQTATNVLSTRFKNKLMVITVLTDGTILFHTLNQSKFVHRGTINAGQRLDLVSVNRSQFVCTFDATIPIDFAHLDLTPLAETDQILTDKDLVKTLISFNPPIGPKPIERLILPDRDKDSTHSTNNSTRLFFTALTKDALYLIHICDNQEISYLRIPGHHDLVSIHILCPGSIYTSQGGIINLYKWKCCPGESACHKYNLFVSIDISSSLVLTIKPASISSGLFLCSMQNGVINAYHSQAARASFKKIPPFPRTTQTISRIEFFDTKAVTLDVAKSELNIWTYQNSTSIDATRRVSSSTLIEDFVLLGNKAVMIFTDANWLEIYSLQSLNKEAMFRLHLRCSARIFALDEKSFVVLTSDAFVRVILRQSETKFHQSSSKQLDFPCSKLFASLLTLKSSRSLAILSDDTTSLAVWTMENIVYMKIDLSPYTSTSLIRLTSEVNEETMLLYFDDKSLLACQLDFSKPNSFHFTPFDTADIFDLKHNCLTTALNGENQLNIHDIHLAVCHEPIQLESECEQLCLNPSATYVFALVKPRILSMYRVDDRRQLGRLFVYDFVTTMIANDQFVVLAMNDRRLLTLMIADPDDPQLPTKIQALPSRNVKETENVLGKNIVEVIDSFLEMSSSDSENDLDSDDDDEDRPRDFSPVQKSSNAQVGYRFVHRLKGRHSLEKMKNDDLRRKLFKEHFVNHEKAAEGWQNLIEDSDDEQEEEIVAPQLEKAPEEHLNLDEIHDKTLEHDRQQLKGVQLANAGSNNLKVVNNYSVTSNTCELM